MLEINKVYNMDCLEGLKDIKDNSISLICTDPPYFLGMTSNGLRGSFNDLGICKPFYSKLASEFKRVLNDDGQIYFFTDWRGYAFYYPILSESLPIKNLIVWDKISGAGNFYVYQYELIIFGCINSRTIKKGGNIWREKAFSSGAKKTNGEKVHPTQKPIELIEKIVLEGSKPKDIILDCFVGSGTTTIACINQDRNYIGFEIDKKYYNIAVERIKNHLEKNKL